MRFRHYLAGAAAVGAVVLNAAAQTPRPRVERDGPVRVLTMDGDDDRAVLGVSTSSSGRRDTLGVLITGLTPGGPAEQAGLVEGNRIAAVNGVSLRLSAADAGEHDMEGVLTRRLVREMRKVKAGDEVTLRVYDDGQFKDLRVKTIAAGDLNDGRRRVVSFDDWDDRPVVGLQLGGGASARDTLGLLVVEVTSNGPAETAGIEEGNRIAAINGVSLTLSREDADDEYLVSAKRQRFSRELGKLEVGADVELRVYGNGQYRTVRLKAARAEDVYGERHRRRGMFMFPGNGIEAMVMPVPPRPPRPPRAPMPPIRARMWDDRWTEYLPDAEQIERAVERALEASEVGIERALDASGIAAERAVEASQRQIERAMEASERASEQALEALRRQLARMDRRVTL
ncbi:MAG: PDZ domain-containing protein [Gemmatimonadaceae bacterium]